MDVQQRPSDFINDSSDIGLNLDPPSPPQFDSQFPFGDSAQSPSYSHTPSYNGSLYNSPYSGHSELSFEGDSSDFGLFTTPGADIRIATGEYDPSEYDNPVSGSLLMFSDEYPNTLAYDPSSASSMSIYGDYSSPSSNGGGESANDNPGAIRSRASSVSSQNQKHLSPSPRMDVAHSFENMSFQSPSWGTDSLPLHSNHRPVSPHLQNPQSPPQLYIPDNEEQQSFSADPNTSNNPQPYSQPPSINAPDGDGESGSGPKLRLVPATPISGGGTAEGGMPFHHGNSLGAIDESLGRPYGRDFASSSHNAQAHSGQIHNVQRPHSTSPSHLQTKFNFPANREPSPLPQAQTSNNNGGFLTTHMPRSRSKSETSLGSPVSLWNPQFPLRTDGSDDSVDIVDDCTVNLNDINPSNQGMLSNNFLTPEGFGMGANVRRSRSEIGNRMGHVRGSRSEDMRMPTSGGLLTVPGMGIGINTGAMLGNGQYMNAQDPPPIRSHTPNGFVPGHGQSLSYGSASAFTNSAPMGHRRASSGSRSERGMSASWNVEHAFTGYGQEGRQRPSPYPSPNASPHVRYDDLPTGDPLDGLGMIPMGIPGMAPTEVTVGGTKMAMAVSKPNVTTNRTAKASQIRRKQEATFACPVPGCTSTFTRSFNLKGHIRSHNEEKPFLCHWPGCGKGFARQHDCKRHEQLHTNYRPFTCDGCNKPFARMDALNRHLRSEGGAECQRILEANGTLPGSGSNSVSPPNGSTRRRSYSRNGNNNSPPVGLPTIPITQGNGMGGGIDVNMHEGGMDWGTVGKNEDHWSLSL